MYEFAVTPAVTQLRRPGVIITEVTPGGLERSSITGFGIRGARNFDSMGLQPRRRAKSRAALNYMSARIKILAVIYILILAGIVFLADWRDTQFLFRPVRRLPYGDKIGHFLLMGLFSLLLNLALKARTIRLWRVNVLLGTLIVLIVVVIEEFSQIFIRGRSFDYTDLIADLAGILIFGEIARLIYRRFSRN
jgi:hypothetical protein